MCLGVPGVFMLELREAKMEMRICVQVIYDRFSKGPQEKTVRDGQAGKGERQARVWFQEKSQPA